MNRLAAAKKITGIVLLLFFWVIGLSQPTQFSLATDISLLRSFKENQRYWAVGQTIRGNFHFTRKDGAYAWLTYYTDGHFTNHLTADAKIPSTTPQQIIYQNKAALSLKEVSLGWTHYLKGNFGTEHDWNLYGYAGFGLMFCRVTNVQSASIDTSLYTVSVLGGRGHFKRLTLDLGLGGEVAIGGDVYIYLEGRTLLPTTDYPSPYLFVNDNAPLTVAANLGIRILFP